ncbi:MAG: DUF1707 domain-containing protein [Propionibacteriaceae bacterium]|jgi:hypothetical protein|nr:DUF1707 domain-containing protein [Propionibacteriaceae bacterium]
MSVEQEEPLEEPLDVGPAVGGDLPVTDGDREHVIGLLNSAFAEGRLLLSERDERIDQARAAQVFDDLIPLTRDLIADTPTAASTGAAAVQGIQPLAPGEPVTDSVVAVFGGNDRSGYWTVRPTTSAIAAFGGIDLDLTQARLTASELRINVCACFGGITIIVPEGTEVVNEASGVFGGIDSRNLVPPRAGMPRITIKGVALFGGVEIRHTRRRNSAAQSVNSKNPYSPKN